MSDYNQQPIRARDVEIRNPFRVTRLPFIARLQRAAFRPRRRVAKRFIGRPARHLYRFCRLLLGLGGRGGFDLSCGDSPKQVTFDATNTQFGALFLPQHNGGYEPEVTAFLDTVVRPGDTIFDVGANWGFFSFFVLSHPSFRGHVHAFEPVEDTFNSLVEIRQQTDFDDQLTCHKLALSEQSGAAHMTFVDEIQSGLARLAPDGRGLPVERARLDDLNLPPPRLIKIDVEGHEAEMLKGATRTISAAKPLIVFESWRESDAPQVTLEPFQLLQEWGYRFYQPTWLADSAAGAYALSSPPAGPQYRLCLVPFPAEQRFLLEEQINVIACHKSQSIALQTTFDQTDSA